MNASSPPRYAPQLDSIRTLAVFPVMVHHLWSEHGGMALRGVKLFFVISGFLITQILVSARDATAKSHKPRRPAILRFYARRCLRIFPLYYGVVFVALALGLPSTRALLFWLLTHLLNFRIAATGEMVETFSHFWSLCVEEQFYLMWPWVIFFVPRRMVFGAAWMLTMSAIAFRLLYIFSGFQLTSGVGTYVLPFASFDSLGAGALVAIAASQWPREKVTRGLKAAAIVSGVLLVPLLWEMHVPAYTAFTVQDTLESFIFCFVVWAAVNGVRGPVGWLLSAPPLVYLGRISYGLYVYHPFMPGLLAYVTARLSLGTVPEHTFAYFAVCSALTVLVASVSWHAFEAPLNGLRRHLAEPRAAEAVPGVPA